MSPRRNAAQVLLAASLLAFALPVHGQSEVAAVRTTILRAGEGASPELREAVDARLVRALREAAGVDEPTISPVAYDEITMAAGCAEQDATCLATILATLDTDALLIRTIRVDAQGGHLSLTHFAAGDETTSEVTRSFEASDATVDALVPAMVRELFHIPDTPSLRARSTDGRAANDASGAESTEDLESNDGGVLVWPFVLSLGVAAAGAGVVLGVLSAASQDEYARVMVRSRADADRADDLLSRARDEALIANVLFIAGGAVAAAGIVWMIVELTASPSDEDIAVGAFATPDAATITIAGRFGDTR